MKPKSKLDFDKIAAGLGAERGGTVQAHGGHFGATQLAADIKARMRTPATGGRPSDPTLTEKRLVALSPATLARLEKLAAKMQSKEGVQVGPLQVASILLERAVSGAEEEGADATAELAKVARGSGRR